MNASIHTSKSSLHGTTGPITLAYVDVNDKERSLSGSIFSCSGIFGDVGGSGAAGFACAACQAIQKRLLVSESWFWSPVQGHVEKQNRSWDSMVLMFWLDRRQTISAYKKGTRIFATKSWTFIRRRMPYYSSWIVAIDMSKCLNFQILKIQINDNKW